VSADTNNTGEMRLFVWAGVVYNYDPVILFAVAHNGDEARRLIVANGGQGTPDDLAKQPAVYPLTTPVGFGHMRELPKVAP
jgi:hypothetical protein